MCLDVENDTQHGVNRGNDSGMFMDSGSANIIPSAFVLHYSGSCIVSHSYTAFGLFRLHSFDQTSEP